MFVFSQSHHISICCWLVDLYSKDLIHFLIQFFDKMQSETFLQEMLSMADSSFKYILIVFNFMTLIVVYIHKNRQKHKKEHHVLFVTSHPDDEVMFFRPSLISISKDYFVHILCLTGKDTERQQELKKSGQKFNIYKLQCLKNDKLRDSMESTWPKDQIQSIVLKYVEENKIKAIFTFDQYGVSNHANHKSINGALKELQYPREQLKVLNKKAAGLTQLQQRNAQKLKRDSIKIYYLRSVNLIRKYSGWLQILIALLRDYCWINLNLIDGYSSMSIHKSQFVWYRKLWVVFSQYTYINSYSMTRINITSKTNLTTQKKISNQQISKIIQDMPTQLQLEKTQAHQEKKQN